MSYSTKNDRLTFWTVYDHPSDLPGFAFVLRRWHLMPNGVAVADSEFEGAGTIEEIRGKLPAGLYRIPAQIDDDRVIVETWI